MHRQHCNIESALSQRNIFIWKNDVAYKKLTVPRQHGIFEVLQNLKTNRRCPVVEDVLQEVSCWLKIEFRSRHSSQISHTGSYACLGHVYRYRRRGKTFFASLADKAHAGKSAEESQQECSRAPVMVAMAFTSMECGVRSERMSNNFKSSATLTHMLPLP